MDNNFDMSSSEAGNTKMFAKLANFGFKRTSKQAFGFYISYLILGIILGFVVGGIAGILNPNNAQEAGLLAGQIMAVPYVLTLAILVAVKRSLLKSFLALTLIGLSGLLALLAGGLGGLIPVAFLTAKSQST